MYSSVCVRACCVLVVVCDGASADSGVLSQCSTSDEQGQVLCCPPGPPTPTVPTATLTRKCNNSNVPFLCAFALLKFIKKNEKKKSSSFLQICQPCSCNPPLLTSSGY